MVQLGRVDKPGNIEFEIGREFNTDLSLSVDTAASSSDKLRSNVRHAARGFMLFGDGFLLSEDEAVRLALIDPTCRLFIRPYMHGKDFAGRSRGMFVIDFSMLFQEEARAQCPLLFDIVRDRVKSSRDANADKLVKRNWWRFGRPRRELRDACAGLTRYIITSETSRHRYFAFLDASVAADNKLIVIADADPVTLGVLSSSIHVMWAITTGGKLGVANDPVYVKSKSFDAFPFPADLNADTIASLSVCAERLDAHRKSAIARDERVTMTGMYDVVAKLLSGEPLTPKERTIHELAACGVLRDIHDELDALVAEAYGWPWPIPDAEILERLVALHDERVEEEKRGIIRWLRPEYQAPGQAAAAPAAELELPDSVPADTAVVVSAPGPWPAGAIEQIGALKRLVHGAALTAEQATARFSGARREIVERHLETLAILGEVREAGDGSYVAAGQAAYPAASDRDQSCSPWERPVESPRRRRLVTDTSLW